MGKIKVKKIMKFSFFEKILSRRRYIIEGKTKSLISLRWN